MSPRTVFRLGRVLVLGLVLSFLLLPTGALAQGGQPPSTAGHYYVVQPGDTWFGVSWHTGIPVAELKAANPDAVRPDQFLWVGDRLFIPAAPSRPPIPSSSGPSSRQAETGYWYRVQPGDNWYIVSRDTGVSVLDLWHANPSHLHPNRWLYVGHWLWIPTGEGAPRPRPVVGAGSGQVGPSSGPPTPVPTVRLRPSSVLGPQQRSTPRSTPVTPVSAVKTVPVPQPIPTRPIATAPSAPSSPAAATPSPTAEVEPSPTSSPTATASPTSPPPPTPTPSPTETPVPAVEPEPSPLPGSTEVPVEPVPLGCPEAYEDYPVAINTYLNRPGATAGGLGEWLTGCGAISTSYGSVITASISREDSADVVVVIGDPEADVGNPHSTLLIYHPTSDGYLMTYQAEGAGQIDVQHIGDINEDGRSDVVWSDTTCGAHTCFSTLFVDSWDGRAYLDWIEGTPTMAYAAYAFIDTVPGGSGKEILAHGGVIGSTGAGPQRAWTETYISPEDGPYELYGQVYDESTCLYHQIVDANQAFEKWASTGFEPAIEAYQVALTDDTLVACWIIDDEIDTLRDFARFRLVVAHVANSDMTQAQRIRDEIANPALAGAADVFLESYQEAASVVQACRDVTTYAEANPESWEFLADWGYANPSFSAQDLCPLG